ncbi:MAG: hypothetical protein M1831_006566 [Alyxoria varia]|nr:MAG: hypothetical protein M1831_006566 [Alyxoria varia]
MSSIGKLSGSLIFAVNENFAAFANLKIDFSLLKVEAPNEFNPLGMALSERRREEAETGDLHKTARRLDAMFAEVIPPCPKLIKAYGARVSEIMKRPEINPQGDKSHGPFQEHVAADGTAIWSAATSGLSAIGALLLAALLARAWEAKEAVSIWVELIEQHKKQIKARFSNGESLSQSTLASACQDIPRDDLLAWDASARSWLRSADEAKAKQKTQLDLVQKNLDIPFHQCSSTYDSILFVWVNAMKAVEELLCGRPQDIRDGSILLALSAWHLYPNLTVLGHRIVNVNQDDPLVPLSGVATVGSMTRKKHEEL